MISYEKMTLAHIRAVAEIEGLCFSGRFGEATFLRELENKIAYYVVAVNEGKVSGYGGLWNICGEADITVGHLQLLCDAMDISLKDFFNGESSEGNELSAVLSRLSPKQKQLLIAFLESL